MSRVESIEIRGARVHNLKNIDVSVPLHKIVGIAGVSGSGKSSLAMGVLYAEGSRRYLDSLSAYTRRRMSMASKADVDEVLHVPAALALRQRPGIAGIRSTFGTGTELLNSLRLMFSRLGSHICPNGHHVPASLLVAAEKELVCPICGARFFGPSAEDLSFNGAGACPDCSGTGIVRTVDRRTLVPDESLSIEEGAVVVWGSLMWSLMVDVCREMGVRTNVPFRELSERERKIVFEGPAKKKHILYKGGKNSNPVELDFTYYNAVYTVQNALAKIKDESGMKRISKFLKEDACPSCRGTRLSEKARAPLLCGINLAQACRKTLSELIEWVKEVPASLPEEMRSMANSICDSFLENAKRLSDLGLEYLSLDRAASTLSTGERQRMQLARAVRNRTSGVLYVLDEPSIGLHPNNIEGLLGVMRDLVEDGNSVVFVDHDVQILRAADHLIEMGPAAGADGGRLIAEGCVEELACSKSSRIGSYLAGQKVCVRTPAAGKKVFDLGAIELETSAIHTVKPLNIRIPKGRLTVVTGVSGSGKTTLVLESLVPALSALTHQTPLPEHVKKILAPGITAVKLIDATPIGINVRSTVATYANVHDELRKAFAKTPEAKDRGYKAGDFSYNTGKLRCLTCDGTGEVDLDVQFLPDVHIECPDCRGSRYGHSAHKIEFANQAGELHSLPELMSMDINSALKACSGLTTVCRRLETLAGLGLGYLTLGEATPNLSGGEAQRLKLAGEMTRPQSDTVFVFDEPTIGLHPEDVTTLLSVINQLIEHGATVIVIEHDLDVIRNADWIIDMGPAGGQKGGRVVAAGPLEAIKACSESRTGRYL